MEGSKWEHCLQQCSSALHFGQFPVKENRTRQRGGAIETARRGYCLHESREARAGDIERGAGPVLLRPVITARALIPVRTHIARLSVFSVAIHGASTYSLRFVWKHYFNAPQVTFRLPEGFCLREGRGIRSEFGLRLLCKYIFTTN